MGPNVYSEKTGGTMRKSLTLTALLLAGAALGRAPDTVFLEELTWTEVRALIDAGATTVIVPTAGTEQNGPHMVLGKHRYRMEWGSDRIARALGNALVAPVMTYVPEGDIDPPAGHMRYAGTISIPPDVFRAVLDSTARSLAAHGFTDILFIGDSGPNQEPMKDVAASLNAQWSAGAARVHYISDWYYTTAFDDWLRKQGIADDVMGTHAGLTDTALLLAVAPQHVRTGSIEVGKGRDTDGVTGDPTGATAEMGRVGMDMQVEAALAQIRSLLQQP